MRVLIVEDETAAYENLVDILKEVSYDIQISGNTESDPDYPLAAIQSGSGFDIHGYPFVGRLGIYHLRQDGTGNPYCFYDGL